MPNLNHSITLACALLASNSVFSHDWNSARPDSHAPISVMGDHTHNEGEFMVSYRNMQMDMNGLQDGTQSVSSQEVLDSGYMMTPTKMTMTMHMFGLMYAPTNKTTMMVMLPYIQKDMDMLMASGMTPSMDSEGLGDIKVGALHNIFSEASRKIHLNLMMSLPTGSIDEEDDSRNVMAYAMQLGSGTFDLLPGITYTAQAESFSYGAQAQATIRLGENDRDYTLGNRYKLQSWVQIPVHQRVSLSLRLAYEDWDNISGKDDELDDLIGITPTADADLQGGNLLSAGIGINVTLPKGHRIALEYNKELEQDLDGPQMAQDDTLTLAWQLAF